MVLEVSGVDGSQTKVDTASDNIKDSVKGESGNRKDHEDSDDHPTEVASEVDLSNLTGRQRKLFELRLKMVSMQEF